MMVELDSDDCNARRARGKKSNTGVSDNATEKLLVSCNSVDGGLHDLRMISVA